MSVTTTSLGANTVHIAISGETSVTNVITAIDAAIVNAGWSQVDISNPYNRIYSAPNVDGVTIKYIGITFDPGALKITTTSYESWNASTHVGTNEAWTFNRAGGCGFAMNFCDILLFVNARWLFVQSFLRNQPSCWSGVIELAREAPEDTPTAGYPCWVWMSNATVMTQIPAATPVIGCVSFPRTVSGATGVAAATATSLQTPYTRFGAATQLGQPFSSLPNYTTYAWNTNDKIVHSTRPVVGTTELHGRMFGLKLTYNAGSPFSQVTLPIDANYAYSASGTSAQHWVLGGYPSVNPTNLFTTAANYPSGYVTSQSINLGVVVRAIMPVGTNMYVSTSSGVFKIDNSSTTPVLLGVISGTSGKDMYSIEYDNVQYVYAGGPDGVYRIDTLNSDTVTFLAITNGVSSLWWDGSNLWAGNRTAATAGQLVQVNVSTFAIANTITLVATSLICGGICSDNAGNTYAFATNGIVYKIVNSSSAVTALYNSGGAYSATGIYFTGALLVIAGWLSSSMTQRTVTLGGTAVTSTTYSNGGYSWAGLPNMTLSKIGVYDVFSGNTANLSTPFVTDLSGVVGNTTSATQPFATYSAIVTDLNRVWALTSGTVYLFTNVFRPDDQTVSYGRFLLPQ